jgi:hypothetical protein
MANFVDPHKVVARKMHFQIFQLQEKIENKKKKNMKERKKRREKTKG